MNCRIQRLLVVRRGALGDLILSLPFLIALKQLHPQADLEVLGPAHLWSIVAGATGWLSRIHELEAFNLSGLYTSGGKISSASREFLGSFDEIYYVGVDPEGIIRSQLGQYGFTHVKFISPFPPVGESVHVSDHLILQLGEHDIPPASLLPNVLPGKADLLLGEGILKDLHLPPSRPLLAIHPGSGSPRKNWSLDHFAEIIRRCLERRRATPIVFLGEVESGEMASWTRNLSRGRFPVLSNLSLSAVTGVLAHCQLYLGNDSGITHLAAALGVPAIALFGVTDPAVWGPRGESVVILTPLVRPGEPADLCGLEVETVWRKVEETLYGIVTGSALGMELG
ncbi:MAG TPA: glycosyltransferase family 9 protein [bacterium]|nr:glycosyltransferase family 9 protein [bacterium]